MHTLVKRCAIGAMSVAVLFFAGCNSSSSAPANEAAAAKKPAVAEPVTGKTALWPMYTAAKKWTDDAVILHVGMRQVPGFKNDDGKAAEWEATFGSPSLRALRVDTYAIVNKPPEVLKGVTSGLKEAWSGSSANAMPIDASSITVDSDAAVQAAAADKAAAEWIKKNPTKALSSIELGSIAPFHRPVWYLVWGDKKDGYGVYVDAGSGKVVTK